MSIQKIDVEKVAAAIEADAGEALPDLLQALAEAKAGIGRVTTPEILLCHAPKKSSVTSSAFAEASKPLWRRCATGSKYG